MQSFYIRVVLDVDYRGDPREADILRAAIEDGLGRAIGGGLLADSDEVMVARHRVWSGVGQRCNVKAVQTYLRERIEEGEFTLEDMPQRMVRYGLQEPMDFSAEMQERINLAKTDD